MRLSPGEGVSECQKRKIKMEAEDEKKEERTVSNANKTHGMHTVPRRSNGLEIGNGIGKWQVFS